MHSTAMHLGKLFFETYASRLDSAVVVDIGAQDVNGSLRSVCPPHCKYVGVDFVEGKGVDVVLTDPYQLPLGDASADIIVSSSCFEHSEFFWLLFMEMMRVLRPGGVCYINAPSNGLFHQYPVDCWRFYPDSGRALAAWAQRNGVDAVCVESFVNRQKGTHGDSLWNDTVMVFVKGQDQVSRFPARMLDGKTDFFNGYLAADTQPRNFNAQAEDQQKLLALVQRINQFIGELREQQGGQPGTVDVRFARLAASVNKFIASLN